MDIPLENVIKALENILDWHNIDAQHGERTARIAVSIGSRLNGGQRLSAEKLELLRFAARIHDLGRTGIDHDILTKPGKLTYTQRKQIEAHSEYGFELLKDSGFPVEITYTVLYHHEHWDGSGYPRGLSGLDIPLFPRIVILADMWDAMTSDRPYRAALPAEKALQEMNKAARWFDPKLYAIFLSHLKENRL